MKYERKKDETENTNEMVKRWSNQVNNLPEIDQEELLKNNYYLNSG